MKKGKRLNKKRLIMILSVVALTTLLSILLYQTITKVKAEERSWTQTDWRGGLSSDVVITDVTTFSQEYNTQYSNAGYLAAREKENWDLSAWSYRRKIFFDNTLTNLGVEPENLIDFPVLVKLEDGVNIDYNKTNIDGSDIRFVDTDGTELSYEIEQWDETGDSFVWVKVPQIDVGDQDYIFIYYGNGLAIDNQNGSDVWSNGYKAVFHNNDVTSSTIHDSVSDIQGFKKGSGEPLELEGMINKAQKYDGSNDYSIVNTIFISNPTSLTIASWFRKTGEGNTYECVLHRGVSNTIGSSEYWMGVDLSDNLTATIGATTGVGWNAGLTTVKATLNEWYYLVASWDGSVVRVYINGQYNKQYNLASSGNLSTPTRMGSSDNGLQYQFNGDIDELSISNIGRSSAWVSSEYKSGLNDFNIFHSEESKYEPFAFLISNVYDTGYPSDWGILRYSADEGITIKVRSAINSDMSDATDWDSCMNITNESSVSSGGCVQDEENYLQYRVFIDMTGKSDLITLEEISISFSASDQTPPDVNATNIYLGNSIENNDWLNFAPTIIWDAGVDDIVENEVSYCISLNEVGINEGSQLLNPAQNSGVLPSDDEAVCPHIVNDSSVDLSEVEGLSLTTNKKYFFSIKAIDPSGNIWEGVSQEYQDLIQFRYDNSPPSNVMYISTPSTDFGNVNDMFFNWPITGASQATDDQSAILGWQYAINSSASENWKGTDTHSKLGIQYIPLEGVTEGLLNLTGERDGSSVVIGNNTIYFRAIDNAGNVSTYVTGGINYGGAAPEFPAESVVTINPTTSISNSFSLSWPEAIPGDGDEIESYYYMINTQPPSSLSTLRANSNIYIPTTQLNVPAGKLVGAVKGTNNVYVVAVDNQENYSPTKAIHGTFQLNSTYPDAPLNLSAADLSIKDSELWRVALTWEEPGYKGNGNLTYIIERSENKISWVEVNRTSGLSYTDIVPQSKTYYYKVASIDTSNESILNPTYSTYVDIWPKGRFQEPPEIISEPVVTDITTRNSKINWVTDRVSDSKVQLGVAPSEYFQDEMYRSEFVTSHEIELTNLLPGTQYHYRVKWTDEDGNTGIGKESVFQTKPAPVVEDVLVDTVGLNYAIFKLTTTGATKARIVFGKSKTYGGSQEINTSTVESEYSVMLTELEDGTQYHYKIVLTDEEGFEYESFEDHVFTTPPRPQVSNVQIQEKKGVATPTIEVFWESNIAVNSIVKYSTNAKSMDKVDMELIEGEHTMEIEGLDADSEYQLTVEGVDAMGNRAVSDVYAFTTATDTRPPVISSIKSEGDIQSSDIQSDRSRSAQLIISWKTDEPSTSQVLYGEGATNDGFPYSTQTDSQMRYEHVMIVSNLSPSKVYHFKVVSKDSAGNVGESGSVTSITPKSTDTVMESVLGSLGRIFNFF